MSTAYSTASVIIPKGGGSKAGTLYGWRPDVNLLQGIDVVRAAATNVASLVDESGTRVFVGANIPRYDWSKGGSCPSLLVEPLRTNLFDQDLAGSGIATQVITVVNGTEYSVSVEGSGSMALSGAGTGTVTEGSHVTFTASSTSLTLTLTGTLDYCQVETGAYPTSIIYTSGGVATRNADAISKTGIASLIGQSEGTLYIELETFDTTQKRISFSKDSFDRALFNLDTNVDFSVVTSSGVNRGVISVGVITAGVKTKLCGAYSNDSVRLAQDGVLLGTSISGVTYPANTLDSFKFSDAVGTDVFYGRIYSLAWWKTALTDTELTSLTS